MKIQNNNKFMIETETKIVNRPRKAKGKVYNSYFIYIPADMVKDSQFPFKDNDKIMLKVDVKNQRLIIEKAVK